MSLFPRILARGTPSQATLLTRPTFFFVAPTSTPLASSSRRSYSDEAPVSQLSKNTIVPPMEETRFSPTLWNDISADILSQLPPISTQKKPVREIPLPKAPIDNPDVFLKTIGRNLLTKVKSKAPDLTWEQLFAYKGKDWEETVALEVKDRKYVMWCTEKYRQGWDPRVYQKMPKAPKRFRKLGDAVQDGIRMKWSRKLDIGHAPRPWGMKAVYKPKRE